MPSYKHTMIGRPGKTCERKIRNSATAGSTKGGPCQTTQLMKALCKRNRSYKIPAYAVLEARSKKYGRT
jgi:hypothetical protein